MEGRESPLPSAEPGAAPRQCDLIMKGGITSGVIYPEMIADLAEHYRFKSIGGTSAGAIAAVLAAAAEYGRAEGKGTGFAELRRLPSWLGGKAEKGSGSNLFNLFQPSGETRRLFELLVSFLPGEAPAETARSRAFHVVFTALRGYGLAGLLGSLPGLVLLAALCAGGTALPWRIAGLAIALVVLLAGMLIGLAAGILRNAGQVLPGHGFGLCRGRTEPVEDGDRPPGLTDWLTGKINEVAGRDLVTEGPLTFGDLWGTRPAAGGELADRLPEPRQRRIDLRMMTTALTLARPYSLPFPDQTFFFDPDEWRTLFPKEVVRWMLDHPAEVTEIPVCQGRRLHPLPEPANLPIVVATRMSLSFPLLLSAVPLYGVDFSSLENGAVDEHNKGKAQEQRQAHVATRCWFSDGGIGSNFPIHFFDRPVPSSPTFGVNLRPFRETHEKREISRPRRNADGRSGWWSSFEGKGGLGAVTGFLGSIVTTMQNWRDNTQMTVRGYSDRVVHVFHSEEEGGMNLNMEEDVIRALSGRGRKAAAEFLGPFAGLVPLPAGAKKVDTTWANHRWVRLRNAMALLEETVFDVRDGVTAPVSPSIDEILANPPGTDVSEANLTHARQALADVVALAAKWEAIPAKNRFTDWAPKPRPEMRIGPRI